MATPSELDQMVAAMENSSDPGWSSDYYLLRYRRRLVIPRIRGKRILELGCAEGGMTRELGKHFQEVVAIDGSPRMIEKAKSEIDLPNIRFECCLLEDFKEQTTFDAIVAACVFEHIENVVPVLRLARRLLVPGGMIHITVPNAGALNRRVGLAMGLLSRLDELHERDRRQGHYRVYTHEALRAHAEEAGFTVTYVAGNFLKPLSDAQMVDWDQKLLDAFFEVGRDLPDLCSEIYMECQNC
jgi:2-polyprenyl-3-methyl-5-hydroxy-6-metoxy-1,4-benzoquinol methylase